MTISRVAALALGTVSLSGLLLLALLGFALVKLDTEQSALSSSAATVGDVVRLQSSLQQWVLLNDLIYASGETYLVHGAEAQGRIAESLIAGLEGSSLASGLEPNFNELRTMLAANDARLQLAAAASTEDPSELDALVSGWDEQSARTVALLEWIVREIDSNYRRAIAADAAIQRNVERGGSILFLAYLVLVLAIWNWLRKRLVGPLQRITSAAETALRTGISLNVVEEGPSEIRELARSTGQLAHVLEAKIAERTTALTTEVATRRAAEVAAAEARDRAEAASRAKSQFIANTSHELRTPLNGVLGMIALLATTGLDEKQRVYARTIRQSGETLLALINDVLDYSKIAAGKLQLNDTEFELVSLVEDAVEVCAEPAHRKGLELVVELPTGNPVVYTGDSARLRQVLINLVGNAVKFTSRGHVHVQVTAEEVSSQRTRLWFAVTDTGIGVAPADQAIIFEPFTQADGSSTRSFGGTGLGLTLCKQLVTLMGGDLGVHSVVGRGSTFSFAVIMARAKQNAAPAREALRARRVLLIDQQDLSRRVLAARLVALEMEVTEAGDLGGALRETAKLTSSGGAFALVIVDPQFAGPSPAAELVERLTLSDVPVIHLTPLYEPPLKANMAPPRADITHLPKPVRCGQLLQALESALTPWPSDERAAPSQASTEPPQALYEHSDSAGGTIAAPSTSPVKVLLVEDNPVNQLVTSEMLRLFGCNVDIVNDGLEGLAKAKEFPYDIILMDCQMPNMDGFEATVAIRAWDQERERKGSTPIIAVTANALATDRERCLAAGMNDYLSKPFGFADLKATLERWLPQALFAPNVARLAPALDIPELEELRSLGATDSQIADVARIYVESSSACLEDMANALKERNRDTLGKAAHKLRGAIGTIGTEMAATLCSRIRGDAANGSWVTLTELRCELTREIEVSNKRLSNIILGLGPEAQTVFFGDPERVSTMDEIGSDLDQQPNDQRPAHGART